jgi:hypothetical protein
MEEPVEMVIPQPYLLFLRDPFRFINAHESFLLGLVAILLTGFTGSLTNTHFDGVLDVHTGAAGPLWAFLTPGFINWLSLAIPLYIASLLIAPRRTHFIAMLGYQAFARAPMLVAALFTLVPAFQRQARQPSVFTADMFFFAVVLLVIIGMIFLMVVWMYKGFKRAAMTGGRKAVIAFVVALIVAEIISKVAFYLLILPSLTLPVT